ncbi:MAG: hypothetical protein Q9179_003839 [Wetmoreana sp. 5 TL-2023]
MILNAFNARSQKTPTPEVHQCGICDLDFQLEFKDLGVDGLALVVTKWLDLGSGLELTQGKYIGWGSDLLNALADRSEENRRQTHRRAGETRAAFEKEDGMTPDALCLQNASFLEAQRYKKIMREWIRGTWIFQAG